MKRLIPTIMALLFIVLISTVAFASEINTAKPKTAVLYCDHLNYSQSTNKELKDYTLDRVTKKLAPTCDLIISDEYVKKLNDIGMSDLTTAERSDIIPIFVPENFDYVVIIDMLPKTKQYSEWNADKVTTSMYLKLLDVKNNRTLYNGKFQYVSRYASPTGHVDELCKQMDQVLEKTFLTQAAQNNK